MQVKRAARERTRAASRSLVTFLFILAYSLNLLSVRGRGRGFMRARVPCKSKRSIWWATLIRSELKVSTLFFFF